MEVKVDEKWIRERVHLQHDNLDDVKSLSLPGSYHEKISHLGTSLHSFTRLKHLDLSRNSVCSLEGVGHLQVLETLNLYYNNISTLKDLFQLRTLTNLKELDIRLNPVTKIEPDHRLFLIHMLPSLKKLDDRSVRDSERKAALMHFNADQASEFTEERFRDEYTTRNDRLNIPRAELVRNLGPRSALDNDDVLVLDAMARKDSDHVRSDFISGSSKRFPDVQNYPREELVNLQKDEEKPGLRDLKQSTVAPHHQTTSRPLPLDFNGNIKAATHLPVQRRAPPDSVYAPHTAQGNFTPTPRRELYHETAEHDSDVTEDYAQSVESYDVARGQKPGERRRLRDMSHEQRPPRSPREERVSCSHEENASSELHLLHKLVDLVDKYWNGSRSLHNHSKFKELAINLLRSQHSRKEQEPEQDTTSLRELRQEMLIKEEQLNRLSEQFAEQEEECNAIRSQLEMEKAKQKQLEEKTKELASLRDKLKAAEEENQALKAKVESQEDAVFQRQRQSDEAINNYQALREDNHKLKQRLDQQNINLQQLNELASMLQESHRSLVATNDHLLLELAQEKDRHQSEVSQLHWSYKQLKKSIDWIPNVEKMLHKT